MSRGHQRRLTLSVQWVLRLLIDAPHSNLFKKIKDDKILKRLGKSTKCKGMMADLARYYEFCDVEEATPKSC